MQGKRRGARRRSPRTSGQWPSPWEGGAGRDGPFCAMGKCLGWQENGAGGGEGEGERRTSTHRERSPEASDACAVQGRPAYNCRPVLGAPFHLTLFGGATRKCSNGGSNRRFGRRLPKRLRLPVRCSSEAADPVGPPANRFGDAAVGEPVSRASGGGGGTRRRAAAAASGIPAVLAP